MFKYMISERPGHHDKTMLNGYTLIVGGLSPRLFLGGSVLRCILGRLISCIQMFDTAEAPYVKQVGDATDAVTSKLLHLHCILHCIVLMDP
jgi:hypothetical protein